MQTSLPTILDSPAALSENGIAVHIATVKCTSRRMTDTFHYVIYINDENASF